MIKLNIPIEPVSKARPRVTRSGHTYTPKKTKDFQTQVGWHFKKCCPNHKPITSLISMCLTLTFKVPKSYSKQKTLDALEGKITNNKDVDNLAKSVLDALNGLAFIDDRQVVELYVKKEYGLANNIEIKIDKVA